MRLKLMAEYGGYSLWRIGGGESSDIDPEELPISAALRARLRRWSERYDATLDRENPAASGFPDEATKRDFDAEGRSLWLALRSELPETQVTYFSEIERRELFPDTSGTPRPG